MENSKSYTLEDIEKMDLSKDKYVDRFLLLLGWWPENIRNFIRVNRVAYSDVTHIYSTYLTLFDSPLQTLVSIFPYLSTLETHNMKIKDEIDYKVIIGFLNEYMGLDDTFIPNMFWNYVVNEDNCYMYEFETRKRSKNERKIDLIRKIVTRLLDFIFSTKDKYINLKTLLNLELLSIEWVNLSLYLCLNNLRLAHSVIDDFMRKNIISIYSNDKSTIIPIDDVIDGIIKDLRSSLMLYERIKKFTKEVPQRRFRSLLINKVNVCIDLLDYVRYEMTQFRQVWDSTEESCMNLEDYVTYYSLKRIKQIKYVYSYFWERIEHADNKKKLIINNAKFELLYNSLNIEELKLSPPHYIHNTLSPLIDLDSFKNNKI